MEDEYPSKPKNEEGFSKPVAWLLGRQLIVAFKWMALYTAYWDKLDQRNWMQAAVHTFDDQAKKGEFWFDYIADTGDGQKAMYSIAYLCLSDLWVEGSPHSGSEVSFSEAPDQKMLLPRGEFLFVGGDTGYHVADYATLAQRFQLPFRWAFDDLKKEGKLADERRRPMFGLPGNHDYYDQLDGFNRQFRRPCTPENVPTQDAPNRKGKRPQLTIPGFERCQEASYVALQLPFNWWFWGLDCVDGKLDTRQQEFFKTAIEGNVPDKLIVATPAPITVMGKYAREDSNLSKTFEDLGLERPFLRNGQKLGNNRRRLDLSGDAHQYARYWGPNPQESTSMAPSQSNYASVVSGLGGAFLHPPRANEGELKEQVIYPSADDARKEVAKCIFNPLHLLSGGYIWLFGVIIALVVYFAATVPKSSKDLIDCILLQRVLGISREQELRLSGLFTVQSEAIFNLCQSADLTPFGYSLIILLSLIISIASIVVIIRNSTRLDKLARERPVVNRDYWPNGVALLVAVAAPCFAVLAFGTYQASHVISDLVFSGITLAVGLGLVWFALKKGGYLHGLSGKIGFAALGAWHALLQLTVPFLLVRVGTWRAWLAVLAITPIFLWIGPALMRRNARWLLAVAWLAHGGLLLYIPVKLSETSAQLPDGWLWMLFFVVAGGFGALMACVWLGWYLAVAYAFDGSHEEVGGAARIERFKEFIRFRLTADDLTGYVIAVDDPQINGRELRPKIIDVFRLRRS
jgi:hypothetical protein